MTTSLPPRRASRAYCAYTVLLCLVPLAFIFCNWQWHSAADQNLPLLPLLLITESGSMPYAVATSALFIALLCRHNRRRLPLKAFLCLIALSIICTQLEQKLLKQHFALARPYIAAINQEQQRSNQDFYALEKTEKQAIVRDWHQQQGKNAWLSRHRIQEIAYRFPSGHSIFSVSWVLLLVVFCSYRWLTFAVALWSAAVMASRVWLGMHLPADLLGGIFYAFWTNLLLIALFYQYLKRYQEKPQESPHSQA